MCVFWYCAFTVLWIARFLFLDCGLGVFAIAAPGRVSKMSKEFNRKLPVVTKRKQGVGNVKVELSVLRIDGLLDCACAFFGIAHLLFSGLRVLHFLGLRFGCFRDGGNSQGVENLKGI